MAACPLEREAACGQQRTPLLSGYNKITFSKGKPVPETFGRQEHVLLPRGNGAGSTDVPARDLIAIRAISKDLHAGGPTSSDEGAAGDVFMMYRRFRGARFQGHCHRIKDPPERDFAPPKRPET